MSHPFKVELLTLAAFLLAALSAAAQIPKLHEVPDALGSNPRYAEFTRNHASLLKQRADLVAAVQKHNAKCGSVTAGTALDKECARDWEILETQRKSYSTAVETFNQSLRLAIEIASSSTPNSLPEKRQFTAATLFADSSAVDLRDIDPKDLVVDPAKVREGPFNSSSISFSRTERVLLTAPPVVRNSAALAQRWSDDPRYKEIQKRWQNTKDMALLFSQSPTSDQKKSYERELHDFYTVKALENGKTKELEELRRSSEALKRVTEQIEAEKKQRIAEASAEWRKELIKAMADPKNDSTYPPAAGPLANRVHATLNTKVATIETLAQTKYLEACRQIVGQGNNSWKLSDFLLSK